MKRRNKVLLSTSISIAIVLSAFSMGVYASENWMNFEGEQQAIETKDDMDEIMEILEQVHEGKITAEEAMKKLDKQIKEKEGRITELEEELEKEEGNKQHIKHLEDELKKANKAVKNVKKESGKHLDNAKKYKDSE